MAFPWYNVSIPEAVKTKGASQRERMYLEEIRTRALLLKRLQFSKAQAVVRIERGLAWTFVWRTPPEFLNQLAAIVEEVYQR